ncbi:MAG: hypothetical protein H0T79_14000 [Deltaproteobacteria bacterium]|nr:hypothetical protein [Deltaproteobacteria bacterium]
MRRASRAITDILVRGLGLLILLIVASLGGSARAAPQVEIKAQTQLQLDKIRLVSEAVAEVSGMLIDRLTGDGISGRVIAIRIAGQTVTATTDSEGKFQTMITVEPGEQEVHLDYRGEHLLDRASITVTTDPARAQIALAITIEDIPGGARLIVAARADDQPVKVPIQLALGAPGDKELTPIAQFESGTSYTLTRKAAGGPGTKRMRARFAGDDVRQAATTEATLELTTTTATTMVLDSTTVPFEDDLEAHGKVTDEDGLAVGRAAVTLTSGDRRLAQGATGEDGSYKFKIEAKIIGEGQFGLQVQADPGRSYMKASRSAPQIIQIAKPEPVPVSYTIAAFVATGLAAGGFFLARTKPWNRFRRATPAADAAQPHRGDADAVVDGGLVINRPGVMSTLRRPNDDGFSGIVRDTVRGRPVGEAVVRLLLGPSNHPTHSSPESAAKVVDEREVRTSADGIFAMEKLQVGEWIAEVAAPGHVTEKFVVSIPHRGELRGVRIDLVPVRERVFQLYRRAAEPVLPETRLWGVWTPRQIVDHVRSRRPSPALSDLTDFVEEVYFSPRLAAEAILPGASERVDRAIRERAPAS